MTPTIPLTIAALKIYFRNRQAIFWTLLLPLLIMIIFGLLDFGEFNEVDMGVVDLADNDPSRNLVSSLESSDLLEVNVGTHDEEMKKLEDGDLDLVLIIPPGFMADGSSTTLNATIDIESQQDSQVGISVVESILHSITLDLSGTEPIFAITREAINTRSLDYVDFLVPGIIAMSIMQMGIFSVTFTLIQYRQQGVLRRLRAAPIRPHNFLVGQVVTRLLVSIIQTLVLLGVAILLFDVTILGNLAVLVILALLGGAIFIAIGFAVSGFAKSEEVGAPVANLIAMPMMFLSGVFFPTDVLPGVMKNIAEFFPLTFLADSMREVATQGAGITDIPWQFLGLAVWIVITFFIATRAFRWE